MFRRPNRERDIEARPLQTILERKRVVPFVKVETGWPPMAGTASVNETSRDSRVISKSAAKRHLGHEDAFSHQAGQ